MTAAPATLPAGTVTFLLTDVEGSTGRWEDDPLAMAAAMRAHDAVVDAVARRCGGARPLEQGEGDSAVLAFSRASDALRAAIQLQREFAAGPEVAGSALTVRIGVHTGEAAPTEAGRYAGGVLNRCARIRGLAHGGQVLVSAAAATTAADHLPGGAALLDLGAFALRGLDQPERLFQLCHPDLRSDFPAIHGGGTLAGAPGWHTSFVGREAELVELRRAVDHEPLVTLTGAGGCGKTRLAVELGQAMATEFPGGAWFADLAAVEDATLVSVAVADVVGAQTTRAASLTAAISERLRRGRCLVILDNCEHVLDEVAELARCWLDDAPELRILATSREPVGIAGEHVWRVASLACPHDDTEADDVAGFDAIRLFDERARTAGSGFVLDAATAPVVGALCRRLDGLPLAIELAAAQTRAMSVQEILGHLDDRFRLLRGGNRTANARQRTLEASVGWSYRLAPAPEQEVLARCSVFVGGFDASAAASVTDLERGAVLDALGGLIDRSLLVADVDGESMRYRMLETIQHFAAERLDESGGAGPARDRHAAHFLGWAERLGPLLEGPQGPATERALTVERDNLGAAYEWMARGEDPSGAARMAIALQRHWANRGPGGDGLATLRSILEASVLTPGLTVASLGAAVEIAYSSGRMRLATSLAEQAIELADELGDRRLEGRVRAILASILNWSDAEAGVGQARDAQRCALEAGDDWGLADAMISEAQHHVLVGELDTARRLLDEAIAVARRLGSAHLKSYAGHFQALVAFDQGSPSCQELLRAALADGREAGDVLLVALSARLSALARSAAGDHEGARAALDVARRASLDVEWASIQIEHAAGDLDAAERVIGRSASSIDAQTVATQVVWHLAAARTRLARGDSTAAADHARAARDRSVAAHHRYYEALADLVEGQRARRLGRDPKAAEAHLHRALEPLAAGRCAPAVAEALDELAAVAADLESAEEAARLLGAADALRRSIGIVRRVPDEAALAAVAAHVRQLLGDDVFEQRHSAGSELRWEEAVAYVRRARGERRRPTHGWESLTPMERQVAELVVEGLTNREIAERLFIGPGTVKTHLSHAFTKLGISRRAQLAAELARREAPPAPTG